MPKAGGQAIGIAQGALDFALGYVQERQQFGKKIADFQGIQFMLADMAIKRLIDPEDVASLVGWLVSDHARSVTGASYTMDGGWTA